MKQALEAWDVYKNASDSQEDAKAYAMMSVAAGKLRAAIAEAEKQEPVAWLGLKPSDMPDGDDPMYDHDFFLKGMAWADAILRKKNTTPPAAQRQWVGLTDEEVNSLRYKRDWTGPWTDMTFARAIEAKLKEKNT
jgi:hypothetical protein